MDGILDLDGIRRNFPALSLRRGGKSIVYFDNACSVLKPQCVIDSVNKWMSENGGCGGGRSSHELAAETDELCENARCAVAEFAGYAPDETVFTANTTAAVNIAAAAFPFRAGKDEAIIFAGSHHSLMLPFLEQQKLGRCRIILAGAKSPLELPENEILELITEKTALVAVPMASNITGQAFDIQKIIRRAHECGAYVLADAAAYIPCHVPPWCYPDSGGKFGNSGGKTPFSAGKQQNNAENSIKNAEKPDFLAFSGHKIGSLPVGVLMISRNLFHLLVPSTAGGGTVAKVSAGEKDITAEYLRGHKRYEAGIQNYPGIISLGEAAKFISGIGRRNIAEHTAALSVLLRAELHKFPGIGIAGDNGGNGLPPSSITSLYFKDKNISAQDFGIFLSQHPDYAVCARIGRHCAMPALDIPGIGDTVRISIYAYNTKEEIFVFLKILEEFLG